MAATLDLGNLLVHMRMDASQYLSMMKRVEARMKRVLRTFTRIGKRMAIVGVGLAATSVKAFSSFDDAMTKSLAIMSDITPQLRKEMERLALEISTNGVTAAKDLARSYFFLASAGLDARQSMAAMGVVERFAVAGAFDMALATDLATDAQSALGLTVKNARQNMINMTRVTDVLTGANTLANATTQQFSEALTSQAGPAMKAYRIELEEGVAVLAAYADQGIKAQRAGNMLSRMLRLMTKGFIANREEWERFNINIFDTTGELKPLYTIIGDLSKVLNDMSTEQRIVTLQLLGFQARSQQAILPLIGLQDRIKKYNEELLKMGGITRSVTEKQLKSFSSQMKILWNNVKNVGIAVGERLAPSLERLGLWFRANKSVIQDWAIAFADRIVFVGDVIKNFLIIMKTDWKKGLRVALDTAIELFIGFGKSLAVVMKNAAVMAANVFIQNFGNSIGRWLIELGKPEGVLGKLSMAIPVITAGRLAIMKVGLGIAEAAVRPSIPTDMRGELAAVWKEVEKELLKFENKLDIDILTGPLKALHSKDTLRKIEFWWARVKDAVQPVVDIFEKLKEGFMGMFGKGAAEGFAGVAKNMMPVISEEMQKAREQIQEMLSALDFEYELLGRISEERERALALAQFQGMVQKAYTGDLEKQLELMEEYRAKLDKLMAGKRGIAAFQERMNQWSSDATNVWANVGDVFVSAFDRMGDELATFLIEGKANFKDFAKSIMKDLLAIAIRAQIIQPIAMGLGLIPASIKHTGGVVGVGGGQRMVPAATFIGAPRLHGGLAADEFPTILQRGESVIPKGGGASPTIVINNNTGQQMKQDGAVKFNGREWVVGIITEEINQYGPLRNTIQGIGQNG